MQVIKANGEEVRFRPQKIVSSVIRAGGTKKQAHEIIDTLKAPRERPLTTDVVLETTLSILERDDPIVAARYDLKRAIRELGPSGYPFERYFAAILRAYGYDTKVGITLKGKRVTQEVDILATKKKTWMIECKFHNQHGVHSGLKEAMYTYARFLDIQPQANASWLVTNTKCTPTATAYSQGVGQRITSWRYPKGESLQELIEEKGLYPVTIVRCVHGRTKEKLYQAHILLAKDLLEHSLEDLHKKTTLSIPVLKRILEEVKGLCS